MNKEKVVIYARVSSDSQELDRQINQLSDYCNKNDFKIIKIFQEKISGLKLSDERQELTNLLNFVSVKENDISGVIIWEISRLGRKISDVYNTIEKLNILKIFVYSFNDRLRTINPDKSINHSSNLILNIMASLGQMERETTISRSKSGLLNSALNGFASGGKYLPYGFRKENKRLVIDKIEEKVIILIFNLYLEGNGTTLICNHLNEKGIPTRYNKILNENETITRNNFTKGKNDYKWVDGTIYSILTNHLYKGIRIYNETDNVGNIIKTHSIPSPKIIDEEIFDEVQKRLKENYNKIGINQTHKYLFDRQLIFCGICKLNYHPHKRTNGKDNRYICLSRRYKKTCGNTGIGIDKLNNSVWYFIRRSENLKRELKKSIDNSKIKINIENLILEISKLNKIIDNLNLNENQLLDLYLDGRFSNEILNERIQLLKDKRINVELFLVKLNSKLK